MLDRPTFDCLVRRSVVALLLLAGSLIATSNRPLLADDALWQTNYDAAFAQAVRQRKPLLIHFYGPHCPPCRKMDREVLHQPEIRELLSDGFVAVKVDAGTPNNPQAGQLVQRFEVHALPCDVILDPLSGRLLSQSEGFQDVARYRSTALRSRSKFDQFNRTQLVDNARVEEPPPEAEASPDQIALGEPQPIVGLDGYSPVALAIKRAWVDGKSDFAWEYKGITYYLASAAELEQFRSNPEIYAPRCLGCDPVILSETDRAVAGDTQFAAFYDGDLYLFESDSSRRRFKANPIRYTRIQHVLKVENIQRVVKSDSSGRVTQ